MIAENVREGWFVANIRQMIDIAFGKGFQEVKHLALLPGRIIGSHIRVETLFGVAYPARVSTALANALWKFSLTQLLLAKRAFLHNTLLGIEVPYAIRTGHDAELAANALGLIDLDRAIIGKVRSLRGTHFDALGVFAMLTTDGQKVHIDIGELSRPTFDGIGSDSYDFVPIISYGYRIYRLAGNRAGQAAYAAVDVGDNSLGHVLLPPLVGRQPLFQARVI
jgi:hypothetical protein